MPATARAWQMLLKGHEEARASPRPLAAADMVLVRLAYAADLPPPGDLMRRLAEPAPAKATSGGAAESRPRRPAEAEAHLAEVTPPDAASAPAVPPPPAPELKSFADVVALAEQKRDLKLKHALLDQVRLVHFKPGSIEINPLPSAPRELGQELMRKLKAWTGRVWIVAVSDEEGERPLGVQRRELQAREIESIREHPKVKEVLQHFPDARIAAVRPTAKPVEDEADIDEESGERFKEDGTNS